MRPIYLDNNATTRVDPEVLAAMLPFFCEQFGNASSSHAFGTEVGTAVRTARRQVKALLGAAADAEILFTSGATEANNAAILSSLQNDQGRNEIVTTAVEHPSILIPLQLLEQQGRIRLHVIGVDGQGRLDVAGFRAALGPRTALATAMWANNETGTIFPVEALADWAHQAGALFHVDAVQAVGKLPIDVRHTVIDSLSLSGHKLHGPKGIGVLYIQRAVPFFPLIRGGHQERGRRAGTENVPAIVGLGKAAELAQALLTEEADRVRSLRDQVEQGLVAACGFCLVNGDREHRLPNTSNIAFEYVDGEAILHHMDRQGLAASSGSACVSGSTEPSHVLKAMGLPLSALHGAIRLSFSRENTPEEGHMVLDRLPPIIEMVRGNSPMWRRSDDNRLLVPDFV